MLHWDEALDETTRPKHMGSSKHRAKESGVADFTTLLQSETEVVCDWDVITAFDKSLEPRPYEMNTT